MTRIHESGKGGERITVDSYHNGLSYNVSFGGDGSSLRNVFLQGEDAAQFRDDWDAMESANPERCTHDIIVCLIDPYLD